MTRELMTGCSQALDDAIESGDERQIWKAIARTNKALMECQFKTSQRVKSINRYIWATAAFVILTVAGNTEIAMKIFSAIFKM